jgi:hypothetical protein
MRQPWMLWYAIFYHQLAGIALLAQPNAVRATGTAKISDLFGSDLLAGFVLLGASALAICLIVTQPSQRLSILGFVPQQVLLAIASLGALTAVYQGHYADGVVRPYSFILADQAPVILTLVLHTIAVVQLHMTGHRANGLRARLDAVQSEAERLRAKLADQTAELSRPQQPPRRRLTPAWVDARDRIVGLDVKDP